MSIFANNQRKRLRVYEQPSLVIDESGAIGGGSADPAYRLNGMEKIREALVQNSLCQIPAAEQATGSVNQPVVVPDVISDPEHDHGQEGHKHSADYVGHHRMHGREANGLFADKPEKKGFWDKLQNFALRYSAGQGNPHALMVLNGQMS